MSHTLKQIRERVMRLRLETVAREADILAERLAAIEDGSADPTVFEMESLGRLYGLDPLRLLEPEIRLTAGDAIEILPSLEEYQELDDATRLKIIAAASAARDVVALRLRRGGADPRQQFKRERPDVEHVSLGKHIPRIQGERLAANLRAAWNLGRGPIDSVRDLIAEKLPSVNLLYAKLGEGGPAGITFVDAVRGPTVVLNLDGKNENPATRRFSLAHELCHLLWDWTGQPLAILSGYLTERSLDREQRANAFAVRFLCPPSVPRGLQKEEDAEAAGALAKYGLPYSAIRLYLRNEGSRKLPAIPGSEFLASIGTERQWVESESPNGMDGFPLMEVPPERRTLVARVASLAYAEGLLQRDEYAELLGLTPAENVERVLAFFALGPPESEAMTA